MSEKDVTRWKPTFPDQHSAPSPGHLYIEAVGVATGVGTATAIGAVVRPSTWRRLGRSLRSAWEALPTDIRSVALDRTLDWPADSLPKLLEFVKNLLLRVRLKKPAFENT